MTRMRLVTIRLSEAEHTCLATAAETARVSLSAFLRDVVFTSLEAAPSAPTPLKLAPAGALTGKVSSRLTAAEAEELADRARECDLPVAAYVRRVLRGSTPSARRPEAHAAVVALSRVGNNLNQLTRLAHGGTLMPQALFHALDSLRAEVHRLREDILAAMEDRP
jgi:mobilization protein NikA